MRTTEVCLLLKSIDETHRAVRVARDLATALSARLTLVELRPTPYPLQPPVPAGAAGDPTSAVVERLRSQGTPVNVRRCVCRDERQAIPFAFSPHSLIVISGRRTWLPTRTERLRRALEAAGHFVVTVDEAVHAPDIPWGK